MNDNERIIFMGSPDFAIPPLEALADAYPVVGVVTQPDRPAGRRSRLTPPPVKVVAEALGLPVYQPERIRDPDAQARLRTWNPTVIVVAAFGQILPPSVLDLPPHGCVNLHASLLPRWRGAAPVAAAILAGDEHTGITLMQMDEGVDTGPILVQRREPIRSDDTRETLTERLAHLAADLVVETLPLYLEGDLTPQPQPEEGARSRPLRKEDGHLRWTESAVELDRRVRAMTPWPGTFTTWKGRRLKVLQAAPLPAWEGAEPPGTVLPLDQGAAVATGEGALQLVEIQLAGKRPLPIDTFLRGQRDFVGSVLGE